MAVLVVLAAFLLPRYLGRSGQPGVNAPATPIERASGVECQSYLQQIRQAMQLYLPDHEERYPGNLMELKSYGVADGMLACPVGKEPYRYDPVSGTVRCPHPGHERF